MEKQKRKEIEMYDHYTIVTLQDLLVDKVSATKVGQYGGLLSIKLKDGIIIHLKQRLWSEAKERLSHFKAKYRISQIKAIELGMF